MALSAGKKILERDGKDFTYPVAANAVIQQGALAMLDTGVLKKAAPGADATAALALVVVGIAQHAFTGGAAAGDVKGTVRRGTYFFNNSSGGDQITLSQVGQLAYVVDEETVAKTSNTNVRPKAGTIVDVESTGVWVRVGA